MKIVTLISLLIVGIFAARRNACTKQESIDAGMRLAADFVSFYNAGELGMIFKKMMKQGATLTSVTAHPECQASTTNMRTTLIEQFQAGWRLEALPKSTFYNSKDSSVVVNVAHLTGQMGVMPGLVDVKLFLAPEEDCTFKIQSMSQTPYGCLKPTV